MRRRSFSTVRTAAGRLLALYAYDPTRAAYLVGVTVAGLIAIGLWGLYGDLVMTNLVVVAITEVLIAVYVLILAAMLERLVRNQDRWQVESALTFRQMLAEAKSFEGDSQAGSPFYARRLRTELEDEVRRCREFSTPFSIVAFRLEAQNQSPSHAIFAQANAEVADLMIRHRDLFLAPTALGMFEYAFYLRNADRATARSTVSYLRNALKRYRSYYGLVVYPEDGDEPALLLRRAIQLCGTLEDNAVA
jgi:hypothetical protein